MKKSLLAAIAACVMASLLLTGCDNKQKRESATLQEQNQKLTERVSELEYLLSQAHAQEQNQVAVQPQAVPQAAPQTTPQAGSVYTVVQGDTLWRIAQRQLGSGSRYKEILALNPQISENRPLPVGTKLNLPAR
ncbi:MAG: LysM peptidoglycan-binding domain-containing protein [Planctomycetaceae bacterium]|nr:LysM peptidoglycan-binding domain-containing protein [Planctomycetaceae bacterium]